MKLSWVQQKFVLHWGEMGTRWGINRTVAQIHTLLYISPKPLSASGQAAGFGLGEVFECRDKVLKSIGIGT